MFGLELIYWLSACFGDCTLVTPLRLEVRESEEYRNGEGNILATGDTRLLSKEESEDLIYDLENE